MSGPDRVRQKLGQFARYKESLPEVIELAIKHGWKAVVSEPGTDGNATRWTLTRGSQSATLQILNKWKWVEDEWLPKGPITRDREGVGVHRFGEDFLTWLTAPGPIDERQQEEQDLYELRNARADAWLRGEAS